MEWLIPYLLFSVGVNLLLFLLAYRLKTDKLTDISYSLTFIAIAVFAFVRSEQSLVDIVLTTMVILWGMRLGGYLFYRIHRIGTDKRFDDIRGSFKSFFLFWLMQGLTCFMVLIPVIMASHTQQKSTDWTFWLGISAAFGGLLLEAIADAQKFRFKNRYPERFMNQGLWTHLQHPNYTGELLFWWAIYFACFSFTPWLGLVGPLWISYIILGFSGIPILREKWNKQYGSDPSFRARLEKTWRLIPWIY